MVERYAFPGHHHGMSLREYYAGQALAGLLANPNMINPSNGIATYETAVKHAAKYADVMMKLVADDE